MQKITAEFLTYAQHKITMKPSTHKNLKPEIYSRNPSVGKTSKEGLYYSFRGIITATMKIKFLTKNFFQQIFLLLGRTAQLYGPFGPANMACMAY
jgi:hypothetical protein